MTEHITQRELRNDSERRVRALDEGESVIVTRRSERVGELRPLRRRRYVDTRVDRQAFFRDLDETIVQSIDPRG